VKEQDSADHSINHAEYYENNPDYCPLEIFDIRKSKRNFEHEIILAHVYMCVPSVLGPLLALYFQALFCFNTLNGH
jgi:hypothetical protein